MYKVLICDDQPDIVNALKIYLAPEGYQLYEAQNGAQAVETVKKEGIHLVLLDVMMPVMDGVAATAKIREFSNVPIVMLTAKGEDMDKILGLDYGADDYITKPFNILEVKARIKAIMRRARSEHEEKEKAKTIQAGDLKLDCESRRVFIADREINLTAKEYDVLDLLEIIPD